MNISDSTSTWIGSYTTPMSGFLTVKEARAKEYPRSNKLLATIKSTSGTKDGTGSFESILSVPTEDRDGEIVDAKAFDPLPEWITIDIDHAMSVEKTIGSGTPYYEDGVLKFKGTFASHPLAQMVRGLVDEGHVRTMSVAYMNAVYETDKKDGLPHLRRGELLNAGIVGIPANRDALITASKSLLSDVLDATTKAGARHSTTDYAHIQAAHDALKALGAECETKASSSADDDTTETTEKDSTDPDVKSPAVPAGPSVDVAALTRRARVAVTGFPLL